MSTTSETAHHSCTVGCSPRLPKVKPATTFAYRAVFGYAYGPDGLPRKGKPTLDLAAVERGLAETFGGVTTTLGVGIWQNPEGKFVEEPVATIMVVTHNPPHIVRARFAGCARMLEQHSFVFEQPGGVSETVEVSEYKL